MTILLVPILWIKRQVLASFNYLIYLLLHYRIFVGSLVFLFALSFVAAIFSPSTVKLMVFDTVMKGFIEKTLNGNQNMFLFILQNNLTVLFMIFIFSLTVIIPLILVLFNSYFLGFFFDVMSRIFSLTILDKPNPAVPFLIVSLLPHGVIELTTFFLSAFCSILLGIKLILGKRILPEARRGMFFLKILQIYIFVFIPLIVIAAAIESTLSGKITDTVYSEITSSGSAEVLPTDLALQKSDLQKLGILAEDAPVASNSAGILPEWASAGLYLYTDSYYQGFVSNKPNGYISKSFVRRGTSLNVTAIDIDILRFSNESIAQNYLVLVKKILSEQGSQLDLKRVSDNRYSSTNSTDNQSPYIFSVNRSGQFVYALYFYYPSIESEADITMLDQIDSLQFEKLANIK